VDVSKARVTRMGRDRDLIAEVMVGLTDRALREIDAAARFQATIAQEPGRRSKGSVSRPTESQAVQEIEGKHIPDPRGHAFQVIDEQLAVMRAAAYEIRNAHDLIVHIAMSAEGRVSMLSSCLCCDRAVSNADGDRLKAGYCEGCYKAWCRGGRADRPRFERERREKLIEDAAHAG
jgi:hypothetical protein